jgi:coproporphyrinogen III oxidase-like Fe-S oxidoreductase
MTQEEILRQFLESAPPNLNAKKIYEQWQALGSEYDVDLWRLPLPLWAQRPYDHSGSQAWEVLQDDLQQGSPDRPFCIYLHIPFCFSKCGFCDSYSFQLRNHAEEHIAAYVDHLCDELKLWSERGSLRGRPVSTVHFGGGTPGFIGEAALTRLVECCRVNFAVSDRTEWALETTTSSLTPSLTSALHRHGFRRLHVGVQTLEEPSRMEIGRCSPREKVLEKISETRSLGWIVSVDLICGLPFQTLPGFLTGIEDLIAAGSNGFSLYELLIYPQNRKWAEQHQLAEREHLSNYLLFQSGAQLLEAHGFKKNLFNHWADAQDKNIYFTFPLRGEDCLAVGAIADGVFGHTHYRHPRYPDYLRLAQADFPGLEGGLRENPLEEAMQPFIAAIESGCISASLRSGLEGLSAGGKEMVRRWLDRGLVEDDGRGGLELTDSGSWFAGNLIADLRTAFPEADRFEVRERPNKRIEKRLTRQFRSGV